MSTLQHLISRIGSASLLLFIVLPLSIAHAVPFSSDITISGDTTFDDSFSFGGQGSFSVIQGGATTTETFVDDTATANPLAGTLTDINDGFGFSGNADVTDDEFTIGFDTFVTTTNASSDIYEVVFKLVFSNMVNADGADAFSDSELSLSQDGSEVAFSDLVSDTLFGDAVFVDEANDGATGTFGESFTDSRTILISLDLNPGDIIELDMFWTLAGGDFASGLAEADLSAFLSVDSVTNKSQPEPVPAPGTLLLLGLGLFFLSLKRRFQKN
ncbi:MAG: PEP-CTERM sorting domain-containing protein [gamma proteobacterium symbiont of Bathyaustriella thionipta]|nr:PEP-CTERM sorting domain-containing protein [gamma proteobacterium symbiont of Bathyaustriella thionipta]MCU7950011.1 PEP-CTERM sorting domain-containing protein [gamma proteobacterium symbiont of Bathyaustriella thionipta]MCU7953810.1 PEP-CTERM sorting domain-containing protein [gamma proteobacterium symbiont of Bathyaustriella thionipta]MCU7956607.1 PEP-CTERM sorting domain-containing protein [gamma proteobacterium symbiont of Bathyaustriella thionipta]MCU7968601.1 PEP-CTERM sorting domain